MDLEAGGDGPEVQLTKQYPGTPELVPSTSYAVRPPAIGDHVAPPTILQRISSPFRSIVQSVRGRETTVSIPMAVTVPSTTIPDTVYVRESSHEDIPKQRLSDVNLETESLLSGDEKQDLPHDLPKVLAREDEHQLLLEAMQKRFVCPNFASDRSMLSEPPKRIPQEGKHHKSKLVTVQGHMKVLPANRTNEIDQLISRLDEAFHEHKPPFDTWDNLMDKLSEVQRKQLVLNFANLEMAWSKNLGPSEEEGENTFRRHLAAYHEMMDELSKEILVIQGIDPQDASDTLPRRRSSDQPDLQALHARLFKTQESADHPSESARPLFRPRLVGSLGDTNIFLGKPFPVLPIVQPRPAVRSTKDYPDQPEVPAILSEPPRYAPPPVPPLVNVEMARNII